MAVDLKAVLGITSRPAPVAPADPAEVARRELTALRAERARREATAPPSAQAAAEVINAEVQSNLEAQAEPESTTLLDDYDELIRARCERSLFRYVFEQWKHCSITKSIPLELGFTPSTGQVLPDRGHIKTICDHLQGQLEDAAAKREDLSRVIRAQNLLINCPPRSLKTYIIALASAWAWIRWPWMQILYVSATPKNVLDTARLFRDAVTSPWYQRLFARGAWKLRDDQDALSSMGNTAGGARRGFGWSANILGQNADWLQIDDAHSMDDTPDKIKTALEHYDGNISSRMNDPRTGIRTAIMQRAARGDFSDHVLGHGWFHLRMPMEFEHRPECQCPQCLLGAAGQPNAFGWMDWRVDEGEILHPRYTPEYLAERRTVLRSHGYAGQMQQRPSPKEGNQFKIGLWRFATIEGLEGGHPRPFESFTGPAYVLTRRDPTDQALGRLDVDWVALTVDATFGSTTDNASALGLVGVVGKGERRIIVGDYTPGPRSWLQTLNDVKIAVISLANLTAWNDRIRVVVEKKALGEALMGQLKEAIADGKLRDRWGRTIIASVDPYEPIGKGDKEKRAEVMEPLMDAGLIMLLDGAKWLTTPVQGSKTTLVDEFAAFPKGDRDDRVDAMSQIVDKFLKRKSDWARLFGGK